MDIGRDVGLISGITYEDCTGSGNGTGACGQCSSCARRASKTVAKMVIDWRYTRRGRSFPSASAEEQLYAVNLVKRTLAILGLPGGAEPLCPECTKKKAPVCALCLIGARLQARPVGSGEAAHDVSGPSASPRLGDRSGQYGVYDEAALWEKQLERTEADVA